jgi:hypothetical protein
MKLVISCLAFALFSGLAQAQSTAEAPPASPASASQAQGEATAQARHFEASLEALAKKDYKGAAAEIRQGEALVERAAARAQNEARVALDAAATELRSLASEVESGATRDAQALKSAFARAEDALSLHHREQSGQVSPFDVGA